MQWLLILAFALFPLLAHGQTDYSDDANCIGYYPMEDDGDETDESTGGAEVLTEWSGDIPQSATKMVGTYSRDWERTETESLYQADGGDLDISGADQKISVVMWFDPEATTGTGFYGLAGKYNTGAGQRQYMLMWQDSAVHSGAFCVDDNGSSAVCANGSTAHTTFAHMIGVYNDIDVRYYQDGSLDAGPSAHTAGLFDGTENYNCGRYRSNTTAYWADGLIDDHAVFDRDLSSVEVTDIFNYGVDGSNFPSGRRVIFITKRSVTSPLSKYLRKRLGTAFEPIMLTNAIGEFIVFKDGTILKVS